MRKFAGKRAKPNDYLACETGRLHSLKHELPLKFKDNRFKIKNKRGR